METAATVAIYAFTVTVVAVLLVALFILGAVIFAAVYERDHDGS